MLASVSTPDPSRPDHCFRPTAVPVADSWFAFSCVSAANVLHRTRSHHGAAFDHRRQRRASLLRPILASDRPSCVTVERKERITDWRTRSFSGTLVIVDRGLYEQLDRGLEALCSESRRQEVLRRRLWGSADTDRSLRLMIWLVFCGLSAGKCLKCTINKEIDAGDSE